jgi:hypothetical protein
MRSIRDVLIGLLLGAALSGCYRAQPTVRHLVNNIPADKTLCLGGLRASSGANNAGAESGLVLPGEWGGNGGNALMEWQLPEGTRPGTLVTAEAWCYGEEGEEIGYTRVTGRYRYGRPASISTYPPRSDNPPNTDCHTPTEQRGLLICTHSSLF